MATDLIRYDLLVQNAFRDIFRNVLADVAVKGLPGEHHFLITFHTGAPGVKISDRLKAAHPQDMTIVLQHQFWDLIVTDAGFSVGLSFKGVAEKLVVPFSSVTGFFDPSVNFGAEFTAEGSLESNTGESESSKPAGKTGRPLALATSKGKAMRGSGSEPAELSAKEDAARDDEKPVRELNKPAEIIPVETQKPDATEPKVVSIDAFRKKP